MRLTVELETEEDGRWIAEVLELPGTLAYGTTREDALRACEKIPSGVVGRHPAQRAGRMEPRAERSDALGKEASYLQSAL